MHAFIDLIGEIEKCLFEHQGHQSGKSPIYSLSDLEKGYFRLAIFFILVILPVVFTCYLCLTGLIFVYVCAFSFRTAGEVFSVSLAQGGPAPHFLRQWCFDYLSAGVLDEANLTKDDVDDAELFELIQKVVHFFFTNFLLSMHNTHLYLNILVNIFMLYIFM